MALPNLSGSNIQDTYQRVLHTENGRVFDGTGSAMPINFDLDQDSVVITGSLKLGGFANVSASLASAVASGDGLGNHEATQDLNLNGNSINTVLNISASGHVSSSTMSCITGSFDHIITQNQTIEFRNSENAKVGDIKFDSSQGMRIGNALGGRNKMKVGDIDITGNISFNKLTGGTF